MRRRRQRRSDLVVGLKDEDGDPIAVVIGDRKRLDRAARANCPLHARIRIALSHHFGRAGKGDVVQIDFAHRALIAAIGERHLEHYAVERVSIAHDEPARRPQRDADAHHPERDRSGRRANPRRKQLQHDGCQHDHGDQSQHDEHALNRLKRRVLHFLQVHRIPPAAARRRIPPPRAKCRCWFHLQQ